MQVLKKIDPLSLAKIYSLIMLIFGFIIGVLASTATVFSGAPKPLPTWVLIALPFMYAIAYGIIGFVFGVFGAWMYNKLAKVNKIGGIKIELKSK